jgi:hypothetical protein
MTAEYRFLQLSPAMRPMSDMTLMCLNDTDALAVAEAIGAGFQVEVWAKDRLVGFVKAAGHEASGGGGA